MLNSAGKGAIRDTFFGFTGGNPLLVEPLARFRPDFFGFFVFRECLGETRWRG